MSARTLASVRGFSLSLGLAAVWLTPGCGTAPGVGQTHFALAPQAAPRALMALSAAEAWPWEPRPDAPWSDFDRADLPNGPAQHLDFMARRPEDGPPPGDHKVYYRDGVPFVVHLVEGPAFAVLDNDAADGEATVAFPAGAHDGYLARLGKPGGTLAATDALYFRRETLALDQGPRDWVRLGARAVPSPWTATRGPDVLRFEPRGLTGFVTRWRGAPTPDVPPLPPAIADLTVPPELVAGTRGPATATAAGPGGLPTGTVFRWRTTDPDGVALPEALTDGPALAWLAPPPPGRYLVDVVVETPYFRAIAPAPKPIAVRRELFLDSYAPIARPIPDKAIAEVRDTWPLTPGRDFDVAVEGTMNPIGAPDFAYCAAPEPWPMYESPERINGQVVLDAAYYFAWVAKTCGLPTPRPARLIAFSVDGGGTWPAPGSREGAYQSSHRYTYPALRGAGHALGVRLTDPRVWDNYGRFKITLRRP